MGNPESVELIARRNAIRTGVWVGWLSIVAVGAEIAANPALHHRALVLGLDLAAALGNLIFAVVPWRAWLAAPRGRLLLDLWSAGLIGFVTLLCVTAGSGAEFDLLLFLVLPFLATAHAGHRRVAWLAMSAAAFAAAAALGPLTPAAAALRASLLAATVVLARTFAQSTQVEAERRVAASARAELEHLLIAEAHHRIKNSLQTVSDLLLLARPTGEAGSAFDEPRRGSEESRSSTSSSANTTAAGSGPTSSYAASPRASTARCASRPTRSCSGQRRHSSSASSATN